MFIAAQFIVARTWEQPRCPLTDKQIQKLYIHRMEYYSAIKRNLFESVLMRQMNLEPVIQSEVSQKEKDEYHILMHIREIQKDGTKDFICRAPVEKQTQRIDLRTWERGGEGGIYGESNMETYIIICKIGSQWEFAVCLRELRVYQPRGVGWEGRWEGGSRGQGHMYTCG